jgi:hypothetical protein
MNNLGNTTNTACVGAAGSNIAGVCGIQQPTACGTTAPAPGLSCNLSVAPLGTAPAFTGLQLTGSVAANQNGQIATVATLVSNIACVTPGSPTCLPGTANAASFTSSTNFPGAPISVIAGQTIAVTVNITFS